MPHSMVPESASGAPAPSKIGKYRILRELGRGPVSCVYLGHDPFADREVAIKVVAKNPNSADRIEKAFESEISCARRLVHPHIIEVLDAYVDNERCCVTMEYIDGGSLQKFCGGDALLPPQRVVELSYISALALDFAHRQGVVHGDIKPTNILLRGESDIKLTDFGLAALHDPETESAAVDASIACLSPDRLRNQAPTHQDDIFALGVVMYQMLTGHAPYAATNRKQRLEEIDKSEVIAPSAHRSGLPAELDRIVLSAIAGNPRERYQTWIEFARDLASMTRELSAQQDAITETEKFNALKAVKFFRDFADPEAWETVHMATFRRVRPGEKLVREGERCDSFFLIVQGGARVTKAGKPISVLGDEDCFGEMPYFESRGVRSTSVISITPMTIIEVNASSFRESSDACQKQFNRAFLRILHDRIERLTKANLQMLESIRKTQQEASNSAPSE